MIDEGKLERKGAVEGIKKSAVAVKDDLYFTIEDLAVISYLQKKFHTLELTHWIRLR